MITINANTKISVILKAHPDALDAIVSIAPKKFNKLRNPLLRKLMASRTSINMASKVGGCTVNDFFEKLKPLGFVIDNETSAENEVKETVLPDFMKEVNPKNILDLDVRPILEEGKDPMNTILKKTKEMETYQVLKLINSFEPTPLIQLLENKGYETYTEIAGEDLVHTYFFKSEKVRGADAEIKKSEGGAWEEMKQQYDGKLTTVQVGALEPPLPMLTILEALDNLPEGNALYVYHKRIPVFLLPELKDRGFDYRINEIEEGNVHLFIFKE